MTLDQSSKLDETRFAQLLSTIEMPKSKISQKQPEKDFLLGPHQAPIKPLTAEERVKN